MIMLMVMIVIIIDDDNDEEALEDDDDVDIIVTYLFYCLPVVVFDDTFDDMHEEGLESIPSDGRSVYV
jgi:hypothetical protein